MWCVHSNGNTNLKTTDLLIFAFGLRNECEWIFDLQLIISSITLTLYPENLQVGFVANSIICNAWLLQIFVWIKKTRNYNDKELFMFLVHWLQLNHNLHYLFFHCVYHSSEAVVWLVIFLNVIISSCSCKFSLWKLKCTWWLVTIMQSS